MCIICIYLKLIFFVFLITPYCLSLLKILIDNIKIVIQWCWKTKRK